ncbi:hypothetical protein ETI08_13500 [Macrococcoides goetzii]|nr:hypothetical protein [Macrococcus goetzii]TDM39468.1 hypothetical protein ETI08_13500 [Macrococcus goetzii]
MISVSEIASSSNLSKQSIFNNLRALDIEVVKHKNKAYIKNDEDLQRLLKRLEDNNKGMLTKILESDNQNINKHVVNLINAESSSNIIGLSDTVDEVIKQDVNEVDELNKQLDELIKENDRLIEDNKTLNNEVTSLRTELNSLDKNKSEVIELLKSQIEDLKEDKSNLTRLLDQQQRLSIDSNNRIKHLENKIVETEDIKESHSNHVHAEREDRNNKQSQSFLSRIFKR